MWLFAVFLIVPLIEIALFIEVGGWLTLWPTIAIVFATGIIGVFLVRLQGLRVLAELRGSLSQMRDPLSPLAHGAMILFAGALLLTPGFFTDTIGFLLLIPALRRLIIARLAGRITVFAAGQGGQVRPEARDDVVDAEYSDVTPPEIRPRDPRNPPSRWTED